MRTWQQYLESLNDDGMLHQPRLPVSARIRRKITIPGQITPPHYKDIADKHGHKDRSEFSTDFEPTHQSLDIPNLSAMVLSNQKGVVKFLLSYGGAGSEPEAMFKKRWKPILAPGQN